MFDFVFFIVFRYWTIELDQRTCELCITPTHIQTHLMKLLLFHFILRCRFPLFCFFSCLCPAAQKASQKQPRHIAYIFDSWQGIQLAQYIFHRAVKNATYINSAFFVLYVFIPSIFAYHQVIVWPTQPIWMMMMILHSLGYEWVVFFYSFSPFHSQ